jgi:hypothetical protein
MISIHGRRGDRQNSATQTISDGMQLLAGTIPSIANGSHDPVCNVE